MKKFYLYILLFAINGFSTFASENIINSINVEGTQRIDVETVQTSQKAIYIRMK